MARSASRAAPTARGTASRPSAATATARRCAGRVDGVSPAADPGRGPRQERQGDPGVRHVRPAHHCHDDGLLTFGRIVGRQALHHRVQGIAAAFANRRQIRAAVNQDFATPDHPVRPGDVVAFFPPVTGG